MGRWRGECKYILSSVYNLGEFRRLMFVVFWICSNVWRYLMEMFGHFDWCTTLASSVLSYGSAK